jgi:hypothetical protein
MDNPEAKLSAEIAAIQFMIALNTVGTRKKRRGAMLLTGLKFALAALAD